MKNRKLPELNVTIILRRSEWITPQYESNVHKLQTKTVKPIHLLVYEYMDFKIFFVI